MHLLHRPPETPSLATWLGRDVPYERELANELLNQMGREKSLMALLALHDKEETKREKRHNVLRCITFVFFAVYIATMVLWMGFHLLPRIVVPIAQGFVAAAAALTIFRAQKASARQKNIITALFDYADSPLVADPLCRAFAYYSNQRNERHILLAHVAQVLPLLPDDKDALTKEARASLWSHLVVLETAATENITQEQAATRAFFADWEASVLHYFARTRDKDALYAIRKLAKAKPFSDDGRRVQDAARAALQSFSEPAT